MWTTLTCLTKRLETFQKAKCENGGLPVSSVSISTSTSRASAVESERKKEPSSIRPYFSFREGSSLKLSPSGCY